jgi:uncharacterized membrane protein
LELVIVFLLTIICFPVITLSEGLVRVILGIVFLLIFPGYTMMAALFPNKNSLTGIERAALTIVLSLALVSLTGLILNYTLWGIRLTPIYIAASIIIVLTSGIALLRRYKLPEAERFSPRINIKIPKRSNTSKFDTILSICLAIIVIGAISTLTYVIAQPKTQEAFTDFYILGLGGKMEDYPQELTLGEQTSVKLGIENHELKDTTYNIEVTYDGIETQSIGPLSLTNEEKWSDEVPLTPPRAKDNLKVEFLLYKGEDPTSYLALHLWLNVKE